MFKSKISAVVGFVKKNTTPTTLISSGLAGTALASSSAFAVGETTPFTLSTTLVTPIITALSTNFGVAVTAAFGLLTITLVGKAAFGMVKGMISRAL